MLTKEQLQEAKNQAAQELRSYVNEHEKTWGPEDETVYARLNAAYDVAEKAVNDAVGAEQRAARIKQVEEDSQRISNNPHSVGRQSKKLGFEGEDQVAKSRLALSGWAKGAHANEQERVAAQEANWWGRDEITLGGFGSQEAADAQDAICGRDANSARSIVREQLNKRALSSVSAIYGGYTVPASFQASLEVNMLAYGSVLQAARIIQTTGGEEIRFPTFDDTTNTASGTYENTDMSTATDPTFGRMSWSAYGYTTGVLKVPNDLFADSFVDIDSLIAAALGERLGRKLETDLTTGNGVSKPYGVVTASSLGETTAGATAITFEEIMDLKQSLPKAYRDMGAYMFHDDVLHYVRKLKDSEGRFMWVNGIAPGLPDTLYNSPVFINQAMAGFTSGLLVTATKHMLFGNFKNYIVRRAGGIVIRRLVERYAEYNQTGFVAMMRADGNVLSAGATQIVHMLQA